MRKIFIIYSKSIDVVNRLNKKDLSFHSKHNSLAL